MDVYDINADKLRISKKTRLRLAAVYFATGVPIYFTIQCLVHRHDTRAHYSLIAAGAIMWGLFTSISLGFFYSPPEYQIILDDDQISTKCKWPNWPVSRTVRREEVQTVVETKRGLLISRHSRRGTYFWGGITVPKQLADYEYVKRVISTWQSENARK